MRLGLWTPFWIVLTLALLAGLPSEPAQSSGSPARLTANNNVGQSAGVEVLSQTSESSSATVSTAPSAEAQQKTLEQARHRERSELKQLRRTDVLLMFFNGLLAIFTLALVIVGAYQARQLRASVDVTKEAADAAKMSAEAAKEGAKVAQLALQSDRPFVLVEELKLHHFHGQPRYSASRQAEVIGPVTASFRLRNCGKGPALIEEVLAHLRSDEKPNATTAEFDPHERLPIYGSILGAGEQSQSYHTSLVESFFLVSERDQIREGKRTLSLSGRLRYKDVFKREYETGFCYVYHKPDQLFPEGTMLGTADDRNYST